jgi:hypothetical protein
MNFKTLPFLKIMLLICGFSTFAKAQDREPNWEQNYPEAKMTKIIDAEKKYAEKVEKDASVPPYYVLVAKYRFTGKYEGEVRAIDPEMQRSIQRTLKEWAVQHNDIQVTSSDSVSQSAAQQMVFDKIFEGIPKPEAMAYEALFKIEGKNYWLPIQTILVEPLKKEAKKGDKVLLFCLFTNEHTKDKKLYNCFLISEFEVK